MPESRGRQQAPQARVVIFATSIRNPFVEAWLGVILSAGARAVVLVDAEQGHAPDLPEWLDALAIHTRSSSREVLPWRERVEAALDGVPDTIFYWWGIGLLTNRLPRNAWPDAHTCLCVDTYPNASVPLTEVRERYRGMRELAGVHSVVVTSERMSEMLSTRFRSLRSTPMLPVLSPFPLKSHYAGAPHTPEEEVRPRLCFTGRSDYLFSGSRRMRKDDLGAWLEHLMQNGLSIFVQDPTDVERRIMLERKGFLFYPRVSREGITDGTFAAMLSTFDGNLAYYSVMNATVARRVSTSLSTRFANALCSPTPIIVPPQAEFARDLFSTYPIGVCTDSVQEMRRVMLDSTDSRLCWHEAHAEWAGERYGPDLVAMWSK